MGFHVEPKRRTMGSSVIHMSMELPCSYLEHLGTVSRSRKLEDAQVTGQ